MNKPTVVIPDGDAELSLKVMRCLGVTGAYDTLLVSQKPGNPAMKSKYCSRSVVFTGKTDAELLDLLNQLGGQVKNGIILPVTLAGFQFVAGNRNALQQHYKIAPVPDLATINLASDKWQLFELAGKHGLPLLPSHVLCKEVIDNILNGSSEIPLPVLVKSRNRRGGFGFRKIASRAELEQFGSSLSADDEKEYIIQPFIDGEDYSLSVYCEQGKMKAYTLWRALLYGGRQYSIPRVVRFVEHEKILETGSKLMELLGWHGVCDIDFFVDKKSGTYWLLEVNARFWQTVLAGLAAGVNFPLLLCMTAQGIGISEWPRQEAELRYSRASGVPALFGLAGARLTGIGDLFHNTGYGEILRDPGPEFAATMRRLFGRS